MADTVIYRYPQVTKWAVRAGTTLTAYKWDPVRNIETGPRKTMKFTSDSSASCDADYQISGTQVPHGRFIHVTNGAFAGMCVVKAYVTVYGTPSTTGYNPAPPAGRPSTNIFDYPARYQFGQAYAPVCRGLAGTSCCTDTCCQMIVEFWTEKLYSLNNIRAYSGETNPCSGLSVPQALNTLRAHGVKNYQYAYAVDASWVLSKIRAGYGPILVGTYYGSYPNSTSATCAGVHAELNGRTDCGFRGAHAVLVIGARLHGSHWDFYVRDPDHNSPSRPEKPNYDIITAAQLNTAMKNLPRYTRWNNTFAVYPTTKKTL